MKEMAWWNGEKEGLPRLPRIVWVMQADGKAAWLTQGDGETLVMKGSLDVYKGRIKECIKK